MKPQITLGRLNHIGVATPDLDASIAFYRDVMGASDITEPFVLESQQVRVCFVNTPGEGGTCGNPDRTAPADCCGLRSRQMAREEPLGRTAPYLL